ncbi:hypothetical protein CXG81DRAFT_8571 [Caulochytrium protostelioides]|uniref:prephenate dehydratase n=1 Tax=Caulochytrium protostelioides TaxID=1555241 RepID=A0A4P9XF80_9FUNG|nr:hypothetical protein CXG81DRAFT_8571 [Caulochytrium protostelioides]|eukprot:RKP04235.1 hypothetical protein CXG81DRAFT_8571 [Caulochytrium protostelioides]
MATPPVSTDHRIAYLGPPGTYSYLAARQQFPGGPDGVLVPYEHLGEVIDAVAAGDCAHGVVPYENSTYGSVLTTLDALKRTDPARLQITHEVILRIEHALLTAAPSLDRVTSVYSHPQGLGQCMAWLRKHVPHAAYREASSTAAAAALAAEAPATRAAIAHPSASAASGLPVFASPISDRADNQTRFLVIHHVASAPSRGAAGGVRPPAATAAVAAAPPSPLPTASEDRRSLLLFTVDHAVPGALCRILALLATAKINITQLDTRPSGRTPWEYVFFAEVQAHAVDPAMQDVMAQATAMDVAIQSFGSYRSLRGPAPSSSPPSPARRGPP